MSASDLASRPLTKEKDCPDDPARPAADPFFEQPYQPKLAPEAKPEWELQSAKAGTGARTGSPFIRSKRKVAALFKAAIVVESGAACEQLPSPEPVS